MNLKEILLMLGLGTSATFALSNQTQQGLDSLVSRVLDEGYAVCISNDTDQDSVLFPDGRREELSLSNEDSVAVTVYTPKNITSQSQDTTASFDAVIEVYGPSTFSTGYRIIAIDDNNSAFNSDFIANLDIPGTHEYKGDGFSNSEVNPNVEKWFGLVKVENKDTKSIESKLSLLANPNPFNSGTNFQYSVEKDGNTSLSVYALNGKLVDRIEKHHSKGNYSISWSNNNIPSGQYIVRLQSGNKTINKKINLIK